MLLLLVAACLSCGSGSASGGGDAFQCRTMEVDGGYGYVVLCGADTLILQPFVPALGGRLPFATRAEALATGRLVCSKLADGEPPTLTREEVKACLTDTGRHRGGQ